MAKENNPNDSVYNTKNLSKWFALSSIALLIAVVWAVVEDYDRDWKRYARQNQRIQVAVGEKRLSEAQAAMDSSKLKGLNEQIAQLQKETAGLIAEVDDGIKALKDESYKKTQQYQFKKADLDAFNYVVDSAVRDLNPNAKEMQEKLHHMLEEATVLRIEADKAEAALNKAIDDRSKIDGDRKKKADQLTALLREKNTIEKVIAKNEGSLLNILRNAPLVDFISPTVKIQQVVLANLKDDYFFNKVPRVDRCMTCHATIDKPGFEDFPQPFKSHPKLNMMVGPDSPHPAEKVGCTTCHAGVPQSVDFTQSAHTPSSPKQFEEWKLKYGYQYDHYVVNPMLPVKMTEGQCIQCHAKEVILKDAPTFNAGMRLIEKNGCYGCHAIEGHFSRLAQERKVGPALYSIASKVDETWIKKWLWEPKSFRPTASMPQYWKTHNNSDEKSMARAAVEIDAIAHYLVKKSTPYEPIKKASTVKGNIEHGKQLVGEVGCLGCHAVGDFPRKNLPAEEIGSKDDRIPMWGPELNQMGSKVSEEWLYSWLINPKHYYPNTVMPSLKLNPQEAADIASYLHSKHNEEFESLVLTDPSEKVRDDVILEQLAKRLSVDQAKTKLASMSLEEKRLFVGENSLNFYGCYGCHAIQGHETQPNIGPNLSVEGSKDVSKFSFGNVHTASHSRTDWIATKIRTPRIWDVGKTVDWESRARMPQFNINHEQADAMAAIILGLKTKLVDDEAIRKVDARLEHVIEGQRVTLKYNCLGCHAIEPKNPGGYIYAHFPDDRTLGPPLLYTQGAKTQTTWLHDYLLNPDVKIRPWVKVRMPQFWMKDADATAITKYFSAYDNAEYPFASEEPGTLTAAEQTQVAKLVEQLGCLTCHAVRKPGEDVSAAAPHFANVKARLRPQWVVQWLHNPAAIMPGTRMPTLWPSTNDDDPKAPRMGIPGFFGDDAERQINAVRDWLFIYGGSQKPDYPSKRDRNGPGGVEPKPATPATKTASN